MATKRVRFEVVPAGGVQAYSLSVRVGESIPLVNGKATVKLEVGKAHILLWHFVGPNGCSISITGKGEDGSEVVTVKKSSMPPNRQVAGGTKPFKVA